MQTPRWLAAIGTSLSVAIALGTFTSSATARRSAPVFHHLLVRAPQSPVAMRDYYHALFDSAGVRQEMVDGVPGVASGDAHLLFIGDTAASRDRPSALWHFGWGNVVLNEAYAQHYLKEVEWKDARVSLVDRFHLHLNSADPHAAATWYAAAFAADVVLGERAAPMGADDVNRRAEAFVRLGEVTLAFYRTSDALVCSTGQRVDHLGVIADLALAVEAPRPSRVCQSIEPAPEFRPATVIEGPDGLVIEVMAR